MNLSSFITPVFATVSTLVLAACVGHIGDEGSADSTPSSSPSSSSPSLTWVPEPVDCDPTGAATRAPLRRLTPAPYRRALEAIVGEPLALGAPSLEPAPVTGFADDVERNSVSPELLEAYLEDAEVAAKRLVRDGLAAVWAPCVTDVVDRVCAEDLLGALAERAFRRQVSEADVEPLLATYDEALVAETDGDPGLATTVALELAVTRTLLAPDFLYRIELGEPVAASDGVVRLTQAEIASRMAFAYIGGPPPDWLRAAADASALSTPEQRRQAVRQLVFGEGEEPTDRARAQLRLFLEGVLGMRALDEVNAESLDGELSTSLRQESERFLDEVLWTDRGGLAELLSAGFTFVDERLADHYGLPSPTSEWQKVTVPGRVGLLTQGAMSLAAAHGVSDSVVRRGVFITEQLGCVTFPEPPPEAMVVEASMPQGLNPREQADYHNQPACAGCHDLIDPVGLGMLELDGLGRYRDAYPTGDPVDATTDLVVDGEAVTIDGVVELSERLSQSAHAKRCLSAWLFRFAYAYAPRQDDACHLTELSDVDESLVQQWLALAETSAFVTIVQPQP